MPLLLGLALGVPLARADSLLDTLDGALAQARTTFATLPDPASALAFEVVDSDSQRIQATHGALGASQHTHHRTLDVDLRVGTYARDSTHKLRDGGWGSDPLHPVYAVPIAGGDLVLGHIATRAADDLYRAGRKRLLQVRANDSVKVAAEDTSDDYSAAPAVTTDTPPTFGVAPDWTAALVKLSALYLEYPAVYDSSVELSIENQTRWLVNSDGARILDGRQHLRIATWGLTVADDGMELQVYDYVDVADAAHLPSLDAVAAMAKGVAERVTALRTAPLVEPWSGPAILRGRAAGVFFHEIFGHRIEGHRQKDEDEGQTFTHRVGQAVLPDFLSVVDDPTMATRAGQDLNGTYRYDDEGVPAQRVSLVDHGILRGFLMSRSPIDGFPTSNGHGRREPGNAVVARQGNLMVEASKSVPYAQLRAQLVDEVKRQKKDFGLIFDDISGGFTFTGRSTPQAFDVMPVTVWRVWADGRPDELVRGVDLIGTPLTTFSRILAAGDDVDVFNGVCGAESGWVPVSASSPSLLVKEVEIQRRDKQDDRPPLLPAPTEAR